MITMEREKRSALLFLCRQEEVRLWLEDVFREKMLEIPDLVEGIKDGVSFWIYF